MNPLVNPVFLIGQVRIRLAWEWERFRQYPIIAPGRTVSSTDTFVANAERYAASFDKGDLPLPPAKHTAVVACMDTG